MKQFQSWYGLPALLAVLAIAVTFTFTLCEVIGFSLGKYVPLEPILGVAELAAWLFFLGDNAESRTELYVLGFPFAAAFNAIIGWCIGHVVLWAAHRR